MKDSCVFVAAFLAGSSGVLCFAPPLSPLGISGPVARGSDLSAMAGGRKGGARGGGSLEDCGRSSRCPCSRCSSGRSSGGSSSRVGSGGTRRRVGRRALGQTFLSLSSMRDSLQGPQPQSGGRAGGDRGSSQLEMTGLDWAAEEQKQDQLQAQGQQQAQGKGSLFAYNLADEQEHEGKGTALMVASAGLGDEGDRVEAAEEAGSGVGEGELPANFWLYRGMLVAVALIFGTNFGTVKFMENAGAVGSTTNLLRFGISALSLSPFLKGIKTDVLLGGMECGLWIALGYATQTIALLTTDSNKSAFLCSLTVVVVPIINWLQGKGVKKETLYAAATALAGTALLTLGESATISTGDLWALGQAVGFGIAFTRVEHYSNKFPGQALALSAGQMVSVAGVSALWYIFDNGLTLPDISLYTSNSGLIAALAYTGLITTSFAVWLETVALERVPASEMSVIFATEPLFAAVFSSFLLGETMGPQSIGGAALILGACLIAQGPQLKQMGSTLKGALMKKK